MMMSAFVCSARGMHYSMWNESVVIILGQKVLHLRNCSADSNNRPLRRVEGKHGGINVLYSLVDKPMQRQTLIRASNGYSRGPQ